MKSSHSISEVKNRLTAFIHEIEEGSSIHVTRHGKTVAVLMSIDEYEELTAKREGFWESYKTFRNHLDRENLTINDEIFDKVRDQSPGRDVDLS